MLSLTSRFWLEITLQYCVCPGCDDAFYEVRHLIRVFIKESKMGFMLFV